MRNTEREWSDLEKGFGRPVFAIGVNHFRREGEQDQVLLELIWVWVLDDGEGFGHGECYTVGCVLNGERSRDWEKQKSFMRRIYILIDGEYIYLIKRKKIRFKKKNDDVENCGVSKVFGFIYIYR